MFTGIIEEVGSVLEVKPSTGGGSLVTIEAGDLLSDVKLGDSISTNGVCLTVQSESGKTFTAHISHETTSKTTAGSWSNGTFVNLERALKVGDRLGGHILSGHVDGVGEVRAVDRSKGWFINIKLPGRLLKYIILKGSVAVNGVSLTIADLSRSEFGVAVVPQTLETTTLGTFKRGDIVNVECDMLGKYVEKMLSLNEEEKKPLTMGFLKEHGF